MQSPALCDGAAVGDEDRVGVLVVLRRCRGAGVVPIARPGLLVPHVADASAQVAENHGCRDGRAAGVVVGDGAADGDVEAGDRQHPGHVLDAPGHGDGLAVARHVVEGDRSGLEIGGVSGGDDVAVVADHAHARQARLAEVDHLGIADSGRSGANGLANHDKTPSLQDRLLPGRALGEQRRVKPDDGGGVRRAYEIDRNHGLRGGGDRQHGGAAGDAAGQEGCAEVREIVGAERCPARADDHVCAICIRRDKIRPVRPGGHRRPTAMHPCRQTEDGVVGAGVSEVDGIDGLDRLGLVFDDAPRRKFEQRELSADLYGARKP